MTLSDAQSWAAVIAVLVPLLTTAIVTVYNTIATTRVEGKLDTNTEITKTIETNTNSRLTEQDLLLRSQTSEIKALTDQLHQLNAKLVHDEETRAQLATETARGQAIDHTPSGEIVLASRAAGTAGVASAIPPPQGALSVTIPGTPEVTLPVEGKKPNP